MEIVNKARDHVIPSGAVYVGRHSPFGNPYRIGADGTRSQVIEKYRRWLWRQIETGAITRERLAIMKDVPALVCWCAPKACHGEIVRAAIRWAVEDLNRQQEDDERQQRG